MMKREPVKIKAFKDCFCTMMTGTELMEWFVKIQGDPLLQVSTILAIMVVDKDGNAIKTQKEWNEWHGEYYNETMKLYGQCKKLTPTIGEAKKK